MKRSNILRIMCVIIFFAILFGMMYENGGIEGVIATIVFLVLLFPFLYVLISFLNWLMDY